MTARRICLLLATVLSGTTAAGAGDNTDIVRDLAIRVGPVVGSALACRDIARPRIQAVVEKFAVVIRDASANEAERSDLTQVLDRSVNDGRAAVTAGRVDCKVADRQLPDRNRSIAAPSLSSVLGPSSAAAATSIASVTSGPLP